jgi:tRNA-dihydrouridine synthase
MNKDTVTASIVHHEILPVGGLAFGELDHPLCIIVSIAGAYFKKGQPWKTTGAKVEVTVKYYNEVILAVQELMEAEAKKASAEKKMDELSRHLEGYFANLAGNETIAA